MNTNEPQSCDISAKGSSCCSSTPATEGVDLKQHWNNAYTNSLEEKLGWFETDLSPTLKLIEKSGITSSARIINIGAGSTTLVDELLALKYSNIIATDLSEVALNNLENQIGKNKVQLIVDDLTNPQGLKTIDPVDLWIDRAVLHFFTEAKDQDRYFELLKSKIAKRGYVLLAEYNLDGAKKCAGLPVNGYSLEMLQSKLGSEFRLIESFDFTYTMPSGNERPYVYTLFKRLE